MKPLLLGISAAFLLTTCAAYKAQHATATESSSSKAHATATASATSSSAQKPAKPLKLDKAFGEPMESKVSTRPLAEQQAYLVSELDRFREDLKQNGMYDCCVKPACRQCAMTAGECHCREVIAANGPCCGECTQAWVEGRGDAPGIDREKVLEHLGCVRELYEKKTPDGVVPPGQRKDGQSNESSEHHH